MLDYTPEQIEQGRAVALRDVASLPAISPEQMQHVGRYAGAAVAATFEQIGGVARMVAWAETNPTDFFTKLFPKIITKQQNVDHSGTVSIDDAITRLDREAKIPQGNYEVLDAPFEPVHYDL